MNYDQVYVKTREGEEAVHQRTRLVQRNLRTVLILIDGKSSVAELIAKAGGEDVLLSALEHDRVRLLASGFDAVAAKPVNIRHLIDTLQALLLEAP